MDHDYYIGVFEVTQQQWAMVTGAWPSIFTSNRCMRAVSNISFRQVRENLDNTKNASAYWPNPPAANSFLGKLHERTGVWFDIPSEAE